MCDKPILMAREIELEDGFYVRERHFSHVTIYGPVMFYSTGSNFNSCIFRGNPDAIMIPLRAHQSVIVGAIVLENVTFENCDFDLCGFIGTEYAIASMRDSIGLAP